MRHRRKLKNLGNHSNLMKGMVLIFDVSRPVIFHYALKSGKMSFKAKCTESMAISSNLDSREAKSVGKI